MQQETTFALSRRDEFNLPVDKVGSAINGVNDPGRGISQSTLLSPSNSLLSNEPIIREAQVKESKQR
jgi:hypothetical protein